MFGLVTAVHGGDQCAILETTKLTSAWRLMGAGAVVAIAAISLSEKRFIQRRTSTLGGSRREMVLKRGLAGSPSYPPLATWARTAATDARISAWVRGSKGWAPVFDLALVEIVETMLASVCVGGER